MSGVEIAEHIAQLEADGPLLAVAAAGAGLDARVPGCPDWTIRELLVHTGGVHRWAAAIVGGALVENDQATRDAVGTGPPDNALLDWFRTGHEALVSTLRGADPGLECFTFLPAPSGLAFWARRQAHETAIHRVDAESATGASSPIGAAFAADGIAEMLTCFAARRKPRGAGTIGLHPDDGSAPWRVTLTAGGISARPEDGDRAGATVSGSTSDIYRWLWNRAADVRISGDAEVAALWRGIRVRWS